jgi:hypothetical protein
MTMNENFRELSEKLGGFNPHALESFFYWNNPFALKHWTMNVVELVMCVGAALALVHAMQVYRRTSNATNLCFCIISIGYLFAVEVPLYFPALVGGDPEQLRFLHNEFTAGLLYDRTPLYIVALYLALPYPAYVLIERTGIFDRKWGLLPGAVSVGFLHHCFYEIFDHYGPQYGWWVWNYDMYNAMVSSVPLASIYTFAFVGPMGLTLVTRLLVAGYVRRRTTTGKSSNVWHLAGLCLLGSLAALIPLVIFTPDLYYQPVPIVEKAVSFSILLLAAVVTVVTSLQVSTSSVNDRSVMKGTGNYPLFYFGAYLVIFAALWAYALPEYLLASDGITSRGTPIGSLAYTIACFALCLLILYSTCRPRNEK